MHKGIMLALVTACSLLIGGSIAAHAALVSAKSGVTLEQTWNPHPADDDIILPMPCDGFMAFRLVSVPSGGLLLDKRFAMGVGGTEDPARQVYERRFDGYISASLTRADMPEAWRTIIPEADNALYYLIGKYEVSRRQWNSVMQDECPASPTADDDKPMADISWYDVQMFFQRYNAWLIRNAPDLLPRFAGDERSVGFVRLPSEEEWEYAARGGNVVPEEHRNHEDVFPLQGGRLEDFGVFTTPEAIRHNTASIGSRRPNPLGMYDTVGNVKEMVNSLFRFSVADQGAGGEVVRRLHGAAGGVTTKGGSFMSDVAEVVPGWRDELPLYTTTGEATSRDLGFRVTLAGVNVPSGQRLQRVVAENATLSGREAVQNMPQSNTPKQPAAEQPVSDQSITLNPTGHPLAELDKVLAATASSAMRNNLAQLRSVLEDATSAQERQRDETLENSLRSLLYQMESVRNVGFRYWVLHDQYEKGKKTRTKEGNANYQGTMKEFFDLLLTSTNFYKTGVERLAQAPGEAVARHMAQLGKEYTGKDVLSEHMRQNLNSLEKHLADVRSKGVQSLTKERICKDLLSKMFFDILPFNNLKK